MPYVTDVITPPAIGNSQQVTVLHIRGTLADGTPYASRFSAVHAESGEVRSQNAVYRYSSLAWPSSRPTDTSTG